MKNIIIFITIIITHSFAFGQYDCSIVGDLLKSSGEISNSDDYIPDDNTSVKYLRVNIHFMLRSSDHANYPGNFSHSGDGNGNSEYTGYDYAKDLINTANYRLANNSQMNMPPDNSTEVLTRKYKYVVNNCRKLQYYE